MRAAYYERNGPAREVLRIGDMTDPLPGRGEVRVRLAMSGINPSDVKTREGRTRKIAYPRVVPHSDGAGVIDMVGDGVEPGRIGEHVWIYNGQWQRPLGTAAQLIALPSGQAVPLPSGIGFAEGACLGVPAMTAHRAVFADGGISGARVMVAGAAGTVGHYAVQLAKWGGAEVIATVGSPEKAAHARAGGADHVVDYRREDIAERVRAITGGAGVDRVVEVELGANAAIDATVLAKEGTVVAYGSSERQPQLPFFDYLSRNAVVRFIHVYSMAESARQQAIDDIARWAAAGNARFTVAARMPLERIVEAHEAVESGGKTGQILIELP